MYRMPRDLAMARAPYGPHTVTRILVVMGMVVGYTKNCTVHALRRVRGRAPAGPGLRIGRRDRSFRSVGGFPRYARISATPESGRARTPPFSPLGVGAPHRNPYPPASGGNVPCALWFLTRRGYLHPGPTVSPTALDCCTVPSPGEKTNLTQKQSLTTLTVQCRNQPFEEWPTL
jgi:hypothetical protein